jgi:hypothetical protein
MPLRLSREISHARHFAEVMHGATILYNIMVAQAHPRSEELLPPLSQYFQDWCAEFAVRESELRAWDRADFWRQVADANASPTFMTRQFIDGWIDCAFGIADVRDLPVSPDATALIRTRECRLKGPLARLDNARARELWNGNSGLARLEYRWRNAQMILNDIVAARDGHA